MYPAFQNIFPETKQKNPSLIRALYQEGGWLICRKMRLLAGTTGQIQRLRSKIWTVSNGSFGIKLEEYKTANTFSGLSHKASQMLSGKI